MESLIGKIEIIVLVIGFSILIVLYIIYKIMKKKRCNLEVKGKVVERWQEELMHYGYHSDSIHLPDYYTFVLVEYEYNKNEYSIEIKIAENISTLFVNIKQNDEVSVMINPKDPKEYYCVKFQNGVYKYKSINIIHKLEVLFMITILILMLISWII